MATELLFDDCARRAVLEGVDLIADPVRFALGPKGRCAVLEREFGAPSVTGNGLEIVGALSSVKGSAHASLQLMRELAEEVRDSAGDGASTAIVLAWRLLHGGTKNIAAGADPVALRNGMLSAAEAAAAAVKSRIRRVRGREDLLHVAVSAAGDGEIGAHIADMTERAGTGGVITVEESDGIETHVETTRGVRLMRGSVSPSMLTDPLRREAVLEDAHILLTDAAVSDPAELLPLMEELTREGRDLLIIADEIEARALTFLLANNARGALFSVGVRAPEFGDRRKESLHDIAVLTGATVISKDIGLRLADAKPAHLGRARRVVVTGDETLITGAGGKRALIEERRRSVERSMKTAAHGFDREKLRARFRMLSGEAVTLKVGAASETERRDKKLRAEDALCAVRSAAETGVVPGGGSALLHAENFVIRKADSLSGDERTGAFILVSALAAPFRQIAENAGRDGYELCEKVRRAATISRSAGYDAIADRCCDLYEAGVIDPAYVVVTALRQAVSLSSLLLTTGALVSKTGEQA